MARQRAAAKLRENERDTASNRLRGIKDGLARHEQHLLSAAAALGGRDLPGGNMGTK
jgi:hypothetical protein